MALQILYINNIFEPNIIFFLTYLPSALTPYTKVFASLYSGIPKASITIPLYSIKEAKGTLKGNSGFFFIFINKLLI